jgi:hypothetical protein
MSSENTITGRNGKFVVGTTQVARLTQWQRTGTLATKSEWGDSDSAGWTNRAPGRLDSTFTAEGKYDTSDEVFDLFQPEDIVIATLWLDNVDLYYDYPRAMCDNFQLTVNVDSMDVLGWTSSWGTDGICYYPGEAGAPVRTLP